MKREYECPVHGRIPGLGVCWEETPDGPCHYDARKGGTKPQTFAPRPSQDQPEPVDAEFTLPWSFLVSTNKRHGGMAGWSTKEYRQKRDAMAAWFSNNYAAGPHTEPVRVQLELYPANRRHDGHNFQKAIYDALEKSEVLANDKLIKRWEGTVEDVDADDPRCFVTVERWER